jgi:hypothetical protein
MLLEEHATLRAEALGSVEAVTPSRDPRLARPAQCVVEEVSAVDASGAPERAPASSARRIASLIAFPASR